MRMETVEGKRTTMSRMTTKGTYGSKGAGSIDMVKQPRKLRGRILVWMLALLMLACAAWTGMAEDAKGIEGSGLQSDILVLFTSDVHCGVDQNFGYAGLQAIRDAAVAAGNHVLLVDDGDSIQGEAVGILTRGQTNIELMNALKYDVAIPGNHEFDYGMDRFMQLAEMAEFPYISCNFRREGTLVFPPYLLKEIDGVKIAFIGATTPETLRSSTPRYFQSENGNYLYDFAQSDDGQEFYAAVQKAADSARGEGAQYVFLVAHLGDEAACKPYTYADVIEHTTGLDAVLDGHSHDTEKVVMKNAAGKDVIRQACGTKMAAIGWLRVSAKDGTLDTGLYSWNNDIPVPQLLGIDNELARLVEKKTEEIYAQLSEKVGTASEDLTINDPATVDENGLPVRIARRAETNLGDLCADAIREAAGAEICLINGGGLRGSISRGEITRLDVINVYPFGNRYAKIEATGRQILNALEWGVRVVPEENGAFLQCSGLTYEIHTYVDSSCTVDENGLFTGVDGEYRVKNVRVNGEQLDPDRIYTVAGQSYPLIDHGDGQTAFDGAKVLWESEDPDYEALIRYIQVNLGGVVGEEYANPYGQERIIAVAEAAAQPVGVVPVTWEVSPEHPMIDTDEARALYQRIAAGDYPTMEELVENPVVKQLDALSAYYKGIYGNTAEINTPEREEIREQIKDWFLSLGSARTDRIDENGKHHYVYDGPLQKDYQMILALGLPASGKSTYIADPYSEAMGAFILDADVIKGALPEYVESKGAAADSVHFEGIMIFEDAIQELLESDMKGVNIILPVVGTDLEQLMNLYIKPFEAAGYNVKAVFRPAKENEAAARVVMRELGGGQLINSAVAFNFGDGPENVYNELKDMINAQGEPYGDVEEPELVPAA